MAINERGIVEALGTLPLVGNEEGLIPAFGLYLTRHYADYYNRISYGLLRNIERAKAAGDKDAEALAATRAALVETGHICAFNTFGGIMISQEWEAVVKPMIEGRPDWVRGICAVVNALGWGKWEIDNLEAAEDVSSGAELQVSCTNSYESVGYLRDYPARAADDGGVCFLAVGGVTGIMNLLYHGDILTRPPHTEAYYKEIFKAGDARFVGEEVQCRAHGADRCVWKARRVATT